PRNQRRKLTHSTEIRDGGCWLSSCSSVRAARCQDAGLAKTQSPKTGILDVEDSKVQSLAKSPSFLKQSQAAGVWATMIAGDFTTSRGERAQCATLAFFR